MPSRYSSGTLPRVHVLAGRVTVGGCRVPDVPSDEVVILDGVRFHYLDRGGDGGALLLLAGLGCSAHVFWSWLRARATGSGWRVPAGRSFS